MYSIDNKKYVYRILCMGYIYIYYNTTIVIVGISQNSTIIYIYSRYIESGTPKRYKLDIYIII